MFCLPPSSYFLLPLCQLLLFFFFIFPSLWCVPAIMCMYVCTCATQIAVDGFNQMAAPFCSIYFFFAFFWEGALWHLCCTHSRNGPQKRTFRQKCCFKGEKKKIGPHKGGYSNGTHVRPGAALWLTYQPLCCVVRYFFMYYI